MKVGFIGLGQMGAAMAANLIKAGHEVSVFNRTPDKAEPLVKLGAKAPGRLPEVCRAETVITMLANDAAVESVVLGREGILASLPKGALHISASTIGVDLSARLASDHAAAGQRYVAAPVFGRPEAAAAAKLFVVAAGHPDAVRFAMPLFGALGQKTFVLGDRPETANLVKLSGNFLIAAMLEALGEAIALVGKAGIDPKQYVDLLTSSIFDAPIYRTYGNLLAEGRFDPPAFAAPLGYKDIGLTLAAAERLRVPLPLAGLVRDRLLTLLANGGEELDWSALGSLAAKDAGLPKR